jgi:hypothetical protein
MYYQTGYGSLQKQFFMLEAEFILVVSNEKERFLSIKVDPTTKSTRNILVPL